MTRSFRPRSGNITPKPQDELDQIVRKMKEELDSSANYRERSLKMHGWICARCGREFHVQDLHLLTVHHRDGNHHNNPPDGSNWENLCVYCHDDQHGRELLGEYLSKQKKE